MNKILSKNILQLPIHFTAWGVVFGLPFLIFWKYPDFNIADKMLHHGIVVLSMLLVFYTNYFVLIEKLLFRKKLGQFILYNVVLILAVGTAVHFWQEATMPPMPHISQNHNDKLPELLPLGLSFLIRDITTLLVIAGLSVAVKMTGKWYKTEAERQEEDKKRTEAELTNLRQQLNPHFLFNTLNNIYALIEISPEKAQAAMLELSKLLRYVLYENAGNLVPLEREINFIHNYVELMRIRLNPEVELKLELNVSGPDNLIAPLLFIALIENAFKHGASPDKPSFIHITIDKITKREIRCLVKNSYFPKDETDQSGSGIGLENLRRRLEILYPHNHILRTEKEGDAFVSELIFPLNYSNEL